MQFIDNIDPKLRIEIEKQLRIDFEFTKDTCDVADTSFTTVVHRDLWLNNIMIKRGTRILISNGLYKKNQKILIFIQRTKKINGN